MTTTPPPADLTQAVAAAMREAGLRVGIDLVAAAANVLGPLKPSLRLRLLAVIDDPSAETWDDAYSIVIAPWRTAGITLWQAVNDVDLTWSACTPRAGDPPALRWPTVPDTLTILTAIKVAATQPPEDVR